MPSAQANMVNSDGWTITDGGISTAYGNVNAPQSNVGSGTSPVGYYFNLGSLHCGATCKCRAVVCPVRR